MEEKEKNEKEATREKEGERDRGEESFEKKSGR